jgi:isocitrate dehydrogenase
MSDAKRTIAVPIIRGDGIGPEIMSATRSVIDAAVRISSDGAISISWEEVLAGESAFKKTGEWLPEATLNAIKSRGVALKGPLTTPVGGGIRSLNVMIRQKLDLYASIRPVRYFEGVPSPVKAPQKMNIVIFRENTEDVYKGIEWSKGSKEALELSKFLEEKMGVKLSSDTGIGIKPISEFATKRLVRAAIKHAIKKGLKSVTIVHKGNIMKFTEGAFKEWGYEVASGEFPDTVVTEATMKNSNPFDVPAGKVLLNDRIADNMFQQILTRPDEYSVLATPNLNGDYLADACAAQVGGLGLAPGANVGDRVAVFEAVHGTAPKYAGKNVANPCSLMLSGAMMLEHIRMEDASGLIIQGISGALREGILTADLARMSGAARSFGTKEFAAEVIQRMA